MTNHRLNSLAKLNYIELTSGPFDFGGKGDEGGGIHAASIVILRGLCQVILR